MSTVQKISLSLLVAVVLFSGFAVLAFSGMFNYIESNFYDQKVSSEINRNLDKTAAALADFHAANFQRYGVIIQNDWIKSIFLRNQSREDIVTRTNVFGKLRDDIPSLMLIRFVNTDWRQLHYSTLGSDIRNTTDQTVEYEFLPDSVAAFFSAYGEVPASGQYFVVSPQDHAFVYVFEVRDRYNAPAGFGLFYISLDGFKGQLLRDGILNLGDDIAFIQDRGLLLRSNVSDTNPEIRRTVGSYWEGETGESPVFQSGEGRRYVFFDRLLEDSFRLGVFVGDDQFSLNPAMKGILLFSVFLTVFLVAFLVLSIRQDASLVLAERIKKFQINLLQEYLERKEAIDWQKWRSELEIRRDDVRQELKHGMGKLSKKDEENLDRLVDKSWDEIISVLTSRGVEDKTSLEIRKLEGIIEKAVANLQFAPASATRTRPGTKPLDEIPAVQPEAAQAGKPEKVQAVEEAEAVE
ncbi:MAG: hypothetical protein LBK13_12895, partial [Spirochaetales bacterium]|nr:hypothetical protein [Spirochaetales bacterium]